MKLIDILVEELPKRGGWPKDANCITQDADLIVEPATCNPSDANYRGEGFWFLDSSRIGGFEVDTLASDYTTAIITREQYEAALAAKNDDWIDWLGGECPVEKGTLVDVRYRNGEENHHVGAGLSFCDTGSNPDLNAEDWSKDDASSDIIAYRLHQPQEAEQAEADDETDLNECIGQGIAQVWSGEEKPTIGTKCEHHSGGQWEVVTIAGIYENLVTGFTDYWMVKEDGCSYTVGNPYRFRPILSEAERKREKAVQALCNAGGGNGKVDEKVGYGSCWFDVYDAIAAGKIPGVKLED